MPVIILGGIYGGIFTRPRTTEVPFSTAVRGRSHLREIKIKAL
jgi:TRAP-type C4-dicarboxylate transport system permease large subunit